MFYRTIFNRLNSLSTILLTYLTFEASNRLTLSNLATNYIVSATLTLTLLALITNVLL